MLLSEIFVRKPAPEDFDYIRSQYGLPTDPNDPKFIPDKLLMRWVNQYGLERKRKLSARKSGFRTF